MCNPHAVNTWSCSRLDGKWQICPSENVTVCLCNFIGLVQTEQKLPCCLFSLSPSSSWLITASGLSVTHTCTHAQPCTPVRTYSYRLLSSLEAKAQTQAIHVWPWEKSISGLCCAIFSQCFHINAFLFQLGTRFSDGQLKPLGPTETRSLCELLWEHPLPTTQYFEATEVAFSCTGGEKWETEPTKKRVWKTVLPVTCNNWGKACLCGCARWYICNPALLPHGLTRHSEWLPQYPDMFMDLLRAVQRNKPKETTYMKKKTREKGSKSKREPTNRGGWREYSSGEMSAGLSGKELLRVCAWKWRI